MTDNAWRPFGVDSDDEVAEYDALHEGVPSWMSTAFWLWVRDAITVMLPDDTQMGFLHVACLNEPMVEEMCQRLKIALPDIRREYVSEYKGRAQIDLAMAIFERHSAPLQIADYLLLSASKELTSSLDALLERSKSAYRCGKRAGRPGLERRVPKGVQAAADDVMGRAGNAGVRLAKAWEALYGLKPDASTAYRLAIKAVEDVASPLISPDDAVPTLGKVINVMRTQGNWRLPMTKEHEYAQSKDVLLGMMRVLWDGQHDRHGGDPSAPGDVSIQEATVAVSLAVTLVNLFSDGLVARSTS